MFFNRSSHPHSKIYTWPRFAAVALVTLPFAGGCNRFGFRWRDASQSITVHELDPESQKELDEQLERETGRAGLLAGRRAPKLERDPKKETPREYARVDNSAARSKHLTQSKVATTDRNSARLSDDEETIEEAQISIVETNTPEASLAESLERVSPELRKQFELFRQLEAKRSDSIASREDAPSISRATDSNDSASKSGLDSKLASNAGAVPAVTTAAATVPNAEGNAIKLSLNDHANPESANNAVQTAGAVNTKTSEVVTASAEAPTANPIPTVLPPKAGPDKDSKGAENDNWSRFLAQAIDQLQKEIEATPTADENLRLHQQATLRMLYLANGKLEQSMNKIDGLSAHEQEYFRYQLQALHEATNPDAIPVRSRRWSLVMNNQNKASGHLAAVSNLEIKKVAFCNSVEVTESIPHSRRCSSSPTRMCCFTASWKT